MPNSYTQIFQNRLSNFRFIKKTEVNLEKIPLVKLVYLSILLTIVTIFIVFLFQKNLPPEIPLFYGSPEGQEQLASTLGLAIPSIVSLVMIVFNTLISFLLEKRVLKQALSLTSFATSIFATITTFKIIFLVVSF